MVANAEQNVWKKEEIQQMLKDHPVAVKKAVKTIFKFQTADEQRSSDTKHQNGIGFNGVDAYIMSEFAKQLEKGKDLSPKQFEIAKKKIMKYAGQLTRIANGELTLPGEG